MKRLYNVPVWSRSKRWDLVVPLEPAQAEEMRADGAEVDLVINRGLPEHSFLLRRFVYWLEDTFPFWRYRL